MELNGIQFKVIFKDSYKNDVDSDSIRKNDTLFFRTIS